MPFFTFKCLILYSLLIAPCLWALLCSCAHAQQAIINLPSADLTPKGKLFFMNESFVRPYNSSRKPSEWKTTNFATYGLTDTTELAVTTFGAGLPKTDNFTVAVGAKSVIPLLQKRLKERELKFTVGYMLPISFQGRGVGSYGYSHISGRLPKLNTRLTAGVNAGTHQIFGRDTVNFIAGIEHPITPQLNVIAEYYSGTHDFAGLITGVIFHHHKSDVVAVAGFRFPANEQSGSSGFVFELGKFISLTPQAKQHQPHYPKAQLETPVTPAAPNTSPNVPPRIPTEALIPTVASKSQTKPPVPSETHPTTDPTIAPFPLEEGIATPAILEFETISPSETFKLPNNGVTH